MHCGRPWQRLQLRRAGCSLGRERAAGHGHVRRQSYAEAQRKKTSTWKRGSQGSEETATQLASPKSLRFEIETHRQTCTKGALEFLVS